MYNSFPDRKRGLILNRNKPDEKELHELWQITIVLYFFSGVQDPIQYLFLHMYSMIVKYQNSDRDAGILVALR